MNEEQASAEHSAAIDQLCDEFEAALQSGERPSIRDYLLRIDEENRSTLFRELMLLEVELLKLPHDYSAEFPEYASVISDCNKPTQTEAVHSYCDLLGGESAETVFKRFLDNSTRPDGPGRLAHYEIESIIGSGAFGIVAKAFDEKLQRVVAIKMLHPELATTSPARKRFLREARSAAAVPHENLINIYAVEDLPIPYLVMEFCNGKTLQGRIDETGPLDSGEILTIGRQIAEGLAAAHRAKLIHRDIKPSNILITNDDKVRVKITDFGLARAVDDASMTASGIIAGTPMYMAPEQARGEPLDHRADLFSFGSVLYQMATGHPPFRAPTTMAVLNRVCHDKHRPMTDVIPETPVWFCSIVDRLLEKDVCRRFQSAQQVADLLRHCENELDSTGRVTYKSSTDECRQRNRLRKKWMAWLSLLIVVLGAFAYFRQSAPLRSREGDSVASDSLNSITIDGRSSEKWYDWPVDGPPPAVFPFTRAKAKVLQQLWADNLKVPVERDFLIKDSVTDHDVILKLVLIPPGEFSMGTSREDIDRLSLRLNGSPDSWYAEHLLASEGPKHTVVVSRPIYISVTEVTHAQFRGFVDSTGYTTDAEEFGGTRINDIAKPDKTAYWNADLGFARSDAHPVVNISYNDATRFCVWLSRDELTFRLPTEAEWEYCSRAGSLDLYSQHPTTGVPSPQAVATRPKNAFGLYDTVGNVWEWCGGGFREYSSKQFRDYVSGTSGGLAMIRGGGYHNTPELARFSTRFRHKVSTASVTFGFRVVATTDALASAKSSVHDLESQ